MRRECQLFWMACKQGNLREVQRLAPLVDVNKTSRYYPFTSALNVACECERIDVVKFLLTLPSIDREATGVDLEQPLLTASRQGSEEVVALLLADPQVNPNCLGKLGVTPLWMACHHHHPGVARMLLGCGRPIDTQIRMWGHSASIALDEASQDPDLANLIRGYDSTPSPEL